MLALLDHQAEFGEFHLPDRSTGEYDDEEYDEDPDADAFFLLREPASSFPRSYPQIEAFKLFCVAIALNRERELLDAGFYGDSAADVIYAGAYATEEAAASGAAGPAGTGGIVAADTMASTDAEALYRPKGMAAAEKSLDIDRESATNERFWSLAQGCVGQASLLLLRRPLAALLPHASGSGMPPIDPRTGIPYETSGVLHYEVTPATCAKVRPIITRAVMSIVD